MKPGLPDSKTYNLKYHLSYETHVCLYVCSV